MGLIEHLTPFELSEFLSQKYSISIISCASLDLNVYRITLDVGAPWVARVYRRPVSDVQLESELVQYLGSHGFPVETSPVAPAVGAHPSRPDVCVLITQFVPGAHPERNRHAFKRLGQLLGQLSAISLPTEARLRRPGGAWHHLTATGGIAEEVAAARAGLTEYRAAAPLRVAKEETWEDDATIALLLAKLSTVPSCDGLPQAVIHPDLVPPNVIEHSSTAASNATSTWTVLDWNGVGIGPRVLPLAYLLFVAAARGKLALVDFVLAGYGEHVRLESAEIEALGGLVWLRPFTIACWDVFHGRKSSSEVLELAQRWEDIARQVKERVKEICERSKTGESS